MDLRWRRGVIQRGRQSIHHYQGRLCLGSQPSRSRIWATGCRTNKRRGGRRRGSLRRRDCPNILGTFNRLHCRQRRSIPFTVWGYILRHGALSGTFRKSCETEKCFHSYHRREGTAFEAPVTGDRELFRRTRPGGRLRPCTAS